jgi:DNA primase
VVGRIRDDDVRLVRENSPIEAVVGQHLQLRPAGGGSLKGLCPFHEEKTPSFNVSPARGFFHCFGCAAGGDVIDFVRRIEHLSFTEAVESLARRAGITLRYEQGGAAPGRQTGLRQRLLDANAAAAAFYAEQLGSADARPARTFLTERGFDQGAVQRFGCGFAPAGWDGLVRHLRAQRFTDEELAAGGLARHSSRGTLIDAFRGRLVWPIRDVKGDVVGFGARKLRDDDPLAKYLNTGDTPLFKKSQLLYGLDLAKGDIVRTRQVVIVEGYTDVMACHLAGVSSAVATCGTAFGAEHIAVLRRLLMDRDEFGGRVVFTFDGDEAGQRAAQRVFADDQRFVAQTYVAVEPSGADPCELRMAKGDGAVRDLVAAAVPLVEFVIRRTLDGYDLEHPEGRVAALAAAAPMVAGIRDHALRPEYARRLAGWLGMDVDLVRSRVAEVTAGGGQRGRKPGGRPSPPAPTRPAGPRRVVEREALKLALQHPDLAGAGFDALSAETFTEPMHPAVRGAIAGAGGTAWAVGAAARPVGAGDPDDGPALDPAAHAAWLSRVRDAAPDDEVRSAITRLAVEPLRSDPGDVGRYGAALLGRLQEFALTARIGELQSQLQRTDPDQRSEDHRRLFAELMSLEARRRALREVAGGAPA